MRGHWGSRICLAGAILAGILGLVGASNAARPRPPGRLVDLGGHRLHVHCSGRGSPVVVVENGLGDFSFDWVLVQARVSRFTRICNYDRAGYAWSDPGPMPRTFAQINLELKDALRKLGEHEPFVLVGHSFGGPVVRQFAASYPEATAGMVLVDSVFEDQRVPIQGKAVRLRDGAVGKPFPAPREMMIDSDRPARRVSPRSGSSPPLDTVFRSLPPQERRLRIWAAALPTLADAEDSQREWSAESFARMHAAPQDGILGVIPLIVLTRAEGGYANDLDVPAAELDGERKEGQARLARLSTNGKRQFLACGHAMHLEAPDAVAAAIHEVVQAARAIASATSTAARRLDCSDVDFFHLHHRIERALGGSAIGIGYRSCQSQRRNLPGQAPFVLAPAARTLFAAVADNRVPVTISFGLVSSCDLKRECFAVLEGGSAIEPEARNPHDDKLDRQHIPLLPGRKVSRCAMHRANG